MYKNPTEGDSRTEPHSSPISLFHHFERYLNKFSSTWALNWVADVDFSWIQ